ncbi:MAG: phosphate ABC transporter permease PstA, partial [Bacillota bacterium]|nr:phosphate ABC transporter permease PstA [Bacillota bacterium]
TPRAVGEPGGGMANAIGGSLMMVFLASLIGVPVGILGGVYLAEYGRGKRLAAAIRFTTDILNGVPSIVVGIFVYTMLVLPMRRFSALAGAVSLSIIMIPIVMRTTEELVRLVPDTLREAALALGIPRWRTIVSVVLRTAAGGITTGVMLAVARVMGETAPLLFTALNNRYWSFALDQPMASLTVQIYSYAISPFEAWHVQAWAAALVLMALVLLMNVVARFFIRGGFKTAAR